MKLKGLTYIPAEYPKKPIELDSKSIFWWNDNSIFRYPYMMISAFYGLTQGDFDTREFMKIRKDVQILGDSGGFQVWKAQKQGHKMPEEWETGEIAERLNEWYEKNCQLGFILDYPTEDVGDERPETIQKFIDISVRNTKMLNDHYNGKYEFYGALHGNTWDKVENWWESFVDFEFDGWGGGQKPANNPLMNAFTIMYLWEKGVRNIHLFGISGLTIIPLLAYASDLFDRFTFDSSAFAVGRRYKAFMTPWDIRQKIIFGLENKDHNLTKFPCICPICRFVRENPRAYEDEEDRLGQIMSMHNCYHMIVFTAQMKMLSEDKEMLVNYIEKYAPKSMVGIKFIDDAQKYGVEKTFKIYKYNTDSEARKFW